MKVSYKLPIICIFLSLVLSVHGQTQGKATASVHIKVLIIPTYDLMANAGISPYISKFLREILSEESTLELVPFGATLMRTQWQNVYDKKYLEQILEASHADMILMSKLDLILRMDKMDAATWNLSLRGYHVKAKKQKDLSIRYKNLTGEQIKEALARDKDIITSELLSLYNESK